MKITFYINDEDDAHEAANQVLALLNSFKLLTGELQVVRPAAADAALGPTMTSTGGEERSAEVPAKRRRGRPPGNGSAKSEVAPADVQGGANGANEPPANVQGEADGADEAAPAINQGGANGADEAAPGGANGADEPPAVQEHSSEKQEEARLHLRTVARKKGVLWLREILAAQNVQRISDLTNTQVRDVLYANRI